MKRAAALLLLAAVVDAAGQVRGLNVEMQGLVLPAKK